MSTRSFYLPTTLGAPRLFRPVSVGVHTCLSKVNKKENSVTIGLSELATIVDHLGGELNRTLRGQGNALTAKESEALKSIINSAKEKIKAHQNNPFADSNTLLQAKKDIKQELKRLETSVAIQSFFAKASELGATIKSFFAKAVEKITLSKVPPVAQKAMASKSLALNFIKSDLKTAKDEIKKSGGPKPR